MNASREAYNLRNPYCRSHARWRLRQIWNRLRDLIVYTVADTYYNRPPYEQPNGKNS
jgi:hypothetical protein